MRVSTRPALKRLQVIDSAVRREPLPNARTLARELEVTPRTIQRDIEFMRDQLHAPLEFDSVRNGYFRALVRGVCHSRQVSMVYWTASRNETQTRTVDPYDLVLAPDDDWCLIGHCHLRNDIRLFKVQRVRSAVETECASAARPASGPRITWRKASARSGAMETSTSRSSSRKPTPA